MPIVGNSRLKALTSMSGTRLAKARNYRKKLSPRRKTTTLLSTGELSMIYKKGMPITGTNTAMKPKAPVQQKEGAGAQRQIKQPPQPFANPQGPVNVGYASQKESTGTDLAAPGKTAKGTTVGAKALPSGAPVGQRKPINQSKQIAGRFGTSHGGRKAGNLVSGLKRKRNKGFYGG